ncbi:V-type ATP synthase subunit A [Kribbella sp. NPDC023972]|uniref:V-type ATP synthase subunit A n=1 Tax=Kribbella sp. NPDC023972 TaxID=3154795 RepID=UPI0033C93F10
MTMPGQHTRLASSRSPGGGRRQVATDSGRVVRISGPVVSATDLPHTRLFDVVRVGAEQLLGEVIKLDGDLVVMQVFEDTTGLQVGEPVEATGEPLYAELGPGLLGAILDGTQRPLQSLSTDSDVYIARGADPPRLDRDLRWKFRPAVDVGDRVGPGDLLGSVPEGRAIEHRILVPTGIRGVVTAVRPGPATVLDPVVDIDARPVAMMHRWPLRLARPVANRLPLRVPLITGQRVLDLLFPVARGGSAIIPGGFGTGKTVLEQALAKFSTADIVVYVGCGERGNELTEVLEEFPELSDPRSGAPLMERTVLIANTSNMPVAAREASIYSGITIAEYYRDQGYNVAMMADSTSRWGEALREVSSRLEEMPAEDGYPAYLATRLAGFYERAGVVQCLGTPERTGSVTIVGAVSPAGGDFSEPITQNSLRLAGCFWALDTALSRQRHFPAVNWLRSFSQYDLDEWFDQEIGPDWSPLRRWAAAGLQDEGALQEVVSLLGVEALAPEQRISLRIGQALREDLLQQSSFDDLDASCPPPRLLAMLRVIHETAAAMSSALERGVAITEITSASVLVELGRMRRWPPGAVDDSATRLIQRIAEEMSSL